MTKTFGQRAAIDLIYLVSCAVNGNKPDKEICDQMELSDVYNTAIKHSLSVAAAFALEQVMGLPEDFKEAKYKAVRRLSLLNTEREKIIGAFEKKKIWYLPLKGVLLKECYPKSAMREMGDNDILCDSSRMSDIKDIMENLGFECKSFGKMHHDVYEKPPALGFEIHSSLFDKSNDPEFYDYSKDIQNHLIKDNDNLFGYHMTDEDQYIFLVCHLFKHYERKGTGLRSLLDIYVFYRKYGSQMAKEYLDAEFQKLELAEFESGMRELAYKTFTGQPLSQEQLGELSYFIDSNTHGTKENYLKQQLKNDDSIKAKSKYAVSRIFPPKEYLKNEHPFVYRHMALYPFWIVYRPIKGVVKYPGLMIGEIKRLKKFKKKDNSGIYHK